MAMAMKKRRAKVKPRGRGRPPIENPNTTYMPLKVSAAFVEAAKAFADKHDLRAPSTAVREVAEERFRREGLL